jgi:site-specific recombinase XerD
MNRTPPPFPKTASTTEVCCFVPVAEIPLHIESWLLTGDINQHSERTISTRRERMNSFLWFLRNREFAECGLAEIRAFFVCLNHGHKEAGGRWGNPRCTSPLTSGRVKSYHSTLRTFFRWLIAEMVLDVSPMERIPAPVDRPDQIQPFSEEQIHALLTAAKRGKTCPRRDEAILLLLLDTGLRASELCGLDVGDVDLTECRVKVREGKGGKSRSVYFSSETRKALFLYLKEQGYDKGVR